MVDRTGELVEEMIAEERESSSAQIRTLLNEQRKTIIAEYCEKVLHHEFLAAQAEHERRILQGELLRQQQDFREVHQQDLIQMRNCKNSKILPSMNVPRHKFIEDQKTIMELSEQVGVVFDSIMAPSDPEVIVDQVSNLSAAKETVLFLGFFCSSRLNFPSELGIMDDLVQG